MKAILTTIEGRNKHTEVIKDEEDLEALWDALTSSNNPAVNKWHKAIEELLGYEVADESAGAARPGTAEAGEPPIPGYDAPPAAMEPAEEPSAVTVGDETAPGDNAADE